MFAFFRRIFGYKPLPKIQIICNRQRQSLEFDPNNRVKSCRRCQTIIIVSAYTMICLKDRPAEFICVQCAATENPTTPLGSMSPYEISRLIGPEGNQFPFFAIQTVGGLNEYIKILFPSDDPSNQDRIEEIRRFYDDCGQSQP